MTTRQSNPNTHAGRRGQPSFVRKALRELPMLHRLARDRAAAPPRRPLPACRATPLASSGLYFSGKSALQRIQFP
jgi:hypothetical protein